MFPPGAQMRSEQPTADFIMNQIAEDAATLGARGRDAPRRLARDQRIVFQALLASNCTRPFRAGSMASEKESGEQAQRSKTKQTWKALPEVWALIKPRRGILAAGFVLMGIVLLATVVQGLTSFILTQLLSKSAQRLIADLRRRVQAHVGRLPVAFYDANKTGALVSRIMSDVEG